MIVEGEVKKEKGFFSKAPISGGAGSLCYYPTVGKTLARTKPVKTIQNSNTLKLTAKDLARFKMLEYMVKNRQLVYSMAIFMY